MNTLEIDKNYTPSHFEQKLYQWWESQGYFQPNLQAPKGSFTLMIPPPNVTGVLHMGHGLNNSLQDILIRYYRMQGYAALWLPGTDHAGIATQHVVEKELLAKGTSRRELGREAFLQETWQVKDRHHSIITQQLRQIGSSCDWSRERFTLDDGLSSAVREVFVQLYEKDMIYQGEYLTNWCTSCGTAIADDEVEYEDEQSYLYHIRYQLSQGTDSLVIATTRPETLFGDVAVAVHPDDERYSHLVGQTLHLPLTDRHIPIIADSYVDRNFGTACLKVTPAHDANDYDIGQRHQLEMRNILHPDGTLNSNVPLPYQGIAIGKARNQVVQDLESQQFLVKKEPLQNRVGRCYRCHTVIEPYMSKQWFVRMQPMADKALAAWQCGEIVFHPKRWENTYKHWLSNIRDWCISRQLWWGHRIPAWHCQQCHHVTVSRDDPSQCQHCQSTQIVQDHDVLDTWFSSWLWPFSTLGWPNKTPDLAQFYPTSSLVTAYDIIFFWVARMIMAGLEFTGQVPFKDIYITPLVRDKNGRKMSKSLGNGIDPLEVVQEYGADALKFTIAYLSTQGQDLLMDKDLFKLGSKFCNKIWNATRYVLMNVIDDLPSQPSYNALDTWIFGRLNATIATVDKAFADYRFDDMGHAVYEYFWNDLCDWYIEASKASLYSTDIHEKKRATAVIMQILEESLRLLHPFVPFITEELYQKLPNKLADSIMIAPYPVVQTSRDNPVVQQQFAVLQDMISRIRTLRSERQLPLEKAMPIAIQLDAGFEHRDFIQHHLYLLTSLAKADPIEIIETADNTHDAVSLPGSDYTIFVFVKQLIDPAAERAKTLKEITKMQALQASAKAKLENPDFVAKAPAAAIDKERGKLQEAETALEKLHTYLTSL